MRLYNHWLVGLASRYGLYSANRTRKTGESAKKNYKNEMGIEEFEP